MSMSEYRPDCPKCGGRMSAPRYRAPNGGESLVRSCTTYGYLSREPCRDAAESCRPDWIPTRPRTETR